MFVSVVGECGELGRFCPPMRVHSEAENDMVYDLDNILKYYITPGSMFFATSPTMNTKNSDGSSRGPRSRTQASHWGEELRVRSVSFVDSGGGLHWRRSFRLRVE